MSIKTEIDFVSAKDREETVPVATVGFPLTGPTGGTSAGHAHRAAGQRADAVSAAWLAVEPDPLLLFLHRPEEGQFRTTGALICPPFGWDDMCSYRGLRTWAARLSLAGYPAARLSLPSTGDSGGSVGDPDRLDAWVDAISIAARWLRSATPITRVSAIGIGLGGLLTCLAVSRGAPIEDLILWGVPAQGRVLMRQLRAQASLMTAAYPEDQRGGEAEAGLELNGFALSRQTARALEQVDIGGAALPNASDRRVLLLGRDGLRVDRRLREHFELSGAETTVMSASGYSALMCHPQEAQAPAETVAATVEWLSRSATSQASGDHGLTDSPARPAVVLPHGETRDGEGSSWPLDAPARYPILSARRSAEFAHDGHCIRETAMWLPGDGGRRFAILSESSEHAGIPICGVWLNGGALRHVGPNRAWVEVARRWAAQGVPTVRVDLEDLGDSDGDDGSLTNASFYVPQRVEQTLSVLDQLVDQGLPPRFVLGGLCSGAYWSLHAALSDPRVVGALMINLNAFYWSEALAAERQTQKTLAALRGRAWRRLAQGGVSAHHVKTALHSIHPGRLRARAGHPVEAAQAGHIDDVLDALSQRGTEALFLFSQGEPVYEQLVRRELLMRRERWPRVVIEQIPSRDHTFRALWLQRHVHGALDRALERVLARKVPNLDPTFA